ncbi:MAG: hypothetical protein JRH20_27360 [Deltaproteobacteria bacterium]|nr:hypothetical protein [Deltaproteobacteria bacterium]
MKECRSCGGRVANAGVEQICLDCGLVEVDQQAKKARGWREFRGIVTGLLVVAVTVAGVAYGMWIEPPGSGVVTGKLTISGGPDGELLFGPSECFGATRMAEYRFRGVALLAGGRDGKRRRGPDTKMIRVIAQAQGPYAKVTGYEVIVASRSGTGEAWREVSLTAANCPSLKVKLEDWNPWHSTTDYKTDRYQGQVSANCQLPKVGQVKMSLSFEHCRRNPAAKKRSVER